MASITWKRNYNYRYNPGSYRYYKGGTAAGAQDVQLETFIIGHLNGSRNHIISNLKAIEGRSKNTVQRMSRVDTGLMQRLVWSEGNYDTDILRVRFGWRELAPYYAPFQEFGTRTGIKPMRAVQTAYRAAVVDVRKMIR